VRTDELVKRVGERRMKRKCVWRLALWNRVSGGFFRPAWQLALWQLWAL
jgi:hypothetical protein